MQLQEIKLQYIKKEMLTHTAKIIKETMIVVYSAFCEWYEWKRANQPMKIFADKSLCTLMK